LSKPLEVAEPALPAVFAVDKKLFDPAAVPRGNATLFLRNGSVASYGIGTKVPSGGNTPYETSA
jgi:hypothetical protein